MTPMKLSERRRHVPLASLFAVQGADGRWLVTFEEERDRVSLLLFTSEETASRYVNAHPDLLDSPGYSLVLFCRKGQQLLQTARRARAGGIHTFQVDRTPRGDCWFQLSLDSLLGEPPALVETADERRTD